jgi:hypothetical protein
MRTAGERAAEKSELWREYRRAFHEYALAVDEVEALKECANPSGASIEAALLAREKAYDRYENCRDRLAAALLADSSRSVLPRQVLLVPRGNGGRVKDLAELIWELEHKPDGKADDDWFRAESILRRAEESQSVPLAVPTLAG